MVLGEIPLEATFLKQFDSLSQVAAGAITLPAPKLPQAIQLYSERSKPVAKKLNY
jgi:hypothetical protein